MIDGIDYLQEYNKTILPQPQSIDIASPWFFINTLYSRNVKSFFSVFIIQHFNEASQCWHIRLFTYVSNVAVDTTRLTYCYYFIPTTFLNQACTGHLPVHAWFLEIALVHTSEYLCVCPPPRPLITSGMIWCDIDSVWLVKQVLRLFPALNCFIWLLPSIKLMCMALLAQHIMLAYQRRLRWCGASYRRTTWKTEWFSNKGEWVNA